MKIFSKIVVMCSLSMLSFQVIADQDSTLERAQYMLRQVNAQKDQLEQKIIKLQKEIAGLRKNSEKQLKQQKLGNRKLVQENKKKDIYIAQLHNKVTQLVAALKESENERLLANKNGLAVNSSLKTCVDNNHQLVRVNDELVAKYGKKDVWDALAQKEPFTGIEETKIENIMQDYRFKTDDLKINKAKLYKQVGDSTGHAPDESNATNGS